jgi:phage terminase large subunit-like protein
VSASLASSLASLPETERAAILSEFSDDELKALEYDWPFWARPNQLSPEGIWSVWLLLAGRGFGKTRTGAEWVRATKEQCSRIALVAPTAADVRDVVVEGESGILATSPPWDRPTYEPSKRRLTWKNGAIATCYSADEPDRLRGPQHDAAWGDEVAAWRYPDAFDMLMFGLRLGSNPRCVVTTTPKPVKLVRDLIKRASNPNDVRITRGSTYENRSNLAPAFFEQIVARYEGTRLGRQELNAELLEDVPGALWTRALIERAFTDTAPPLRRIVVAIDPAGGSSEESDETGIVACGSTQEGHGYVLADESGRYSPDGWARKAVDLYRKLDADRIIAEVNFGGEMVEATIRAVAPYVPVKVVHASRGKQVRAEPISALYEQNRVHHVGHLPLLEDQMCNWAPGAKESPDRMDALVWALTELIGDKQELPVRVTKDILKMAREHGTRTAEPHTQVHDNQDIPSGGPRISAAALMSARLGRQR